MLDKIISIVEIEEGETMDIETDGNHLFYANDILTHNSSSDVELTDTSESFGLPATADFMFALITTEEMDKLGQVIVKQLKNRYNDTANNKRFVVGINRSKMKLFDVEESAQQGLIDAVANNTTQQKKQFGGNPKFQQGQGDRPSFGRKPSGDFDSKFKGWKV